MMRQRRREQAPAGYRYAYEAVRTRGLAVEITQEELDEVRAAWDLEPASLPAPDQAERILCSKG